MIHIISPFNSPVPISGDTFSLHIIGGTKMTEIRIISTDIFAMKIINYPSIDIRIIKQTDLTKPTPLPFFM